MIFFSVNSLRHAITEFVEHYHRERNHQGLENRLIEAEAIECLERLGGMLRYFYRKAA